MVQWQRVSAGAIGEHLLVLSLLPPFKNPLMPEESVRYDMTITFSDLDIWLPKELVEGVISRRIGGLINWSTGYMSTTSGRYRPKIAVARLGTSTD